MKNYIRSSENYVGTFKAESAVDRITIQAIRNIVAEENRDNDVKKRVVLRGRKPYFKMMVRNAWTGKVGYRGYDWAGNIVGGIKNASVIDVYIYDR